MKRYLFIALMMALGLQVRAAEDVQVVWGCVLGKYGPKEVKTVLDRHDLTIWKEDPEWLYSMGETDYMGATWNGVDACFADGTLMSLYFSIDELADDSLYFVVENNIKAKYRYYENISNEPYVINMLRDTYGLPGCHVLAKAYGSQVILLHYFNHRLCLVFTNMAVAQQAEEKLHPSFCGVTLGQDLGTFCKGLVRKGFWLIDSDYKNGQAILSGRYKGYPVSLLVFAKNGYVRNLWVNYEPKNPSWSLLKAAYDSFKQDLVYRYGAPQSCVEEFYDGYTPKYGLEAIKYEGCKFETEYRNDYYVYNLCINKLRNYLTEFWITDLTVRE